MGSILLVTVPGGRTLYEKHNRMLLATMRHIGMKWTPSESHRHFRTAVEWRARFEQRDHETGIGPLVNDVCHTAVRVPLQSILPVVDQFSRP